MTFNLKTLPVTTDKAAIEWTDVLFGAASQAAAVPEPFELAALRDKLDDYVRRSGTKTASDPFAIEQTWNGAGVPFTGFKLEVTDTDSDPASLLADFRVGGSSLFAVRKDGVLTLGDNAGGPPGSSYQRLVLDAGKTTANMAIVATDNGGTGLAMGLQFGAALTAGGGVTDIFQINTDGDLLWNVDNTYEIGSINGNRPASIHAASGMSIGDAFGPGFAILRLTNSAAAGVGLTPLGSAAFGQGTLRIVSWGGGDATTAAIAFGSDANFPALVRSATEVHCRLADNMADAAVQALTYKVGGIQVLGAQGAGVADASGGATIDAEARAAINALLARARTHGLIAT